MDANAVTLPPNRAFVVQFAARADDGNLFRGRVEHLASGSAARFDSLTRLGEFVARHLEEASAMAGDSGDRGSARR